MSVRPRGLQSLLFLALAALSAACYEPPASDVEPAGARGGYYPRPAVENPDIPASVRPLFYSRCAGCHGMDGKGGPVAPNIFALQDRRTSDEWGAYLQDPQKFGKHMPRIPATDDEYRKLGDWLAAVAGPRGDGAK